MLRRNIKFVAVLLGFAFVFVVLFGRAEAGSQAPRKAAGSFDYFASGYHLTVSARAAASRTPANGDVWNYTPDGGYYHATVSCGTTISSNTMVFAAHVVDTNRPEWGPWVYLQFTDGGSPGPGNDYVWGEFSDEATALAKCSSGATPGNGPWELLSGNLNVR